MDHFKILKRALQITRTVQLNSTVVPADSYDALLKINRELRHPESRTVLIELEECSP